MGSAQDAADRLARLRRASHPVLRWGRDVALRRLVRLATGPSRQQRVQQEDPSGSVRPPRPCSGSKRSRP